MNNYIPKRSFSKHKRSFTLLEVLVVITLISLTIGPLLYPHFATLRDERTFTKEIELDILANVLGSDLLQQLYQGYVPWSDIVEGRSTEIDDQRLRSLGYRGSSTLRAVKGKPKEGPRYHLLEIDLSFAKFDGSGQRSIPFYAVVDRSLVATEASEVEDEDSEDEEDFGEDEE